MAPSASRHSAITVVTVVSYAALPDVAANLLGVVIASGGVWWMLIQIYSPTGALVIPLPTGLVPHIGPIMIALLLVKLFRPRLPSDFWVFHLTGIELAEWCLNDLFKAECQKLRTSAG